MLNPASAIYRELTGLPAQDLTAALTEFHRPPGSAGYHAATNLVAERLRAIGLAHVESTRYPLDGKTVAGHGPLPLAWEPYGADVRIVGPVQEPVVDMETASSCLAWWSAPTPPGGITAELIDVGTGEDDADFEGKDVAGKLVLIGHTARPGGWMHAAREAMRRGARGILSDYLFYEFAPHRTRESLPDAVQLLRLPNQRGEFDAFACSISYPAAERLRALLRLGTVTLHADVRCRLFEGEGQNLLATIEGAERPDESVYFLAHCSAATKPCANCAAGPSLMVEIAGVLHRLIERGEVRRPRRSIKFLFLIEGLGSRVHIDANRDALAKIKTAFCFDSVGHDQGKLKSALLFYRHPDSSPSFVNDFFAGVLERAPRGGTWVFKDDADLAPVQFQQAPYTPWSDNHYWAAYGVPSPLIMSWPDTYFHTQFLTADNTDPRVFRRVGVTTALAAYEIADAGTPEALAIGEEVAARARARLDHLGATTVHGILAARRAPDGEAEARRLAQRAYREVAYLAERDGRAAASVLSLVPEEEQGAARAALDGHADALRGHADAVRARIERAAGALAAAGEVSR
jgi:aminopeptidase YwaD